MQTNGINQVFWADHISGITLEHFLEPKQFKNNLIMFEDKPQFEFCRLLAGSNFEVDAQKSQNDV